MNKHRIHVLVVLGAMLCLGACGSRKRQENQGKEDSEPQAAAQAPAPVASDTRSQHDLAAAIGAAEGLLRDEAEARLSAIRHDWQGKRYRWKVFYVEATCRTADTCHVVPFDRSGADRAILQGWLPRLDISEKDLLQLRQRCSGKPLCKFELEGTLSRLVLSTDELTSLHFSEVRVIE